MVSRAVFSLLVLCALVPAQDFRNPNLPIDVRVADLVSRLTREEKMSLMSSSQPAVARLGIAARNVGSEALHGVAYRTATVFPQAQGLGHTWDPALIRQVGSAVGDEQRVYHNRPGSDLGLQIWSPVVDLARDPRWGRTEEVYSEDPYLTWVIGGAYVHGLQGDDPRYYKTLPSLKHFAANSMENNRGSASSNVDPRNLREYYLAPFERITRDQHVMSYMVAYNAINFMPCAATNLLRDLARAEWGFNGLVVTDAGDMQGLVNGHHYVSTMAEAAAAIVKAGADSITDDLANQAVYDAVTQGLLTESDLDVALRRNFRVRFLLGEFDPSGTVPYDSIPDSTLLSDEHKALARRAGRESVVLLKNSGGLLPLDPAKHRTIAVIGPRANEVQRDWYAGYLPYRVTPADGIRARAANVLFDDASNRITIQARGNGRYVSAGSSGTGALAATSTSPGAGETFLTEDFGWGCTTLRSSVNGMYVSSDWRRNNQLFADSTDAYGWFYSYCFNPVPLTGGGAALQHFENWSLARYLGLAGATTGTLTPYHSSAGTNETFDLVEVSHGATRAAALAAQADVAIVVLGNNTTINGKEAADRPDITLPPAQQELLEAVRRANPNTVLVLVSSYPVAINWAQENVPAIVYTSHGGQELGNFLADVLYGDYNPAGRLTMTWFKSASDLPPIEDFDIRKGRTYWYFQGTPLYPFGHGLSYTTFEYRNLTAAVAADTLRVTVDVQNTGSRAGDEVVQLYVRQRDSKVVRPIRQLRGFDRVTIQPGETRTVALNVPVADLAFWDVRRSKFTVETGTVEVQVGASSSDVRLRKDVPITGEALPLRSAQQVIRAENYDDYSGILLTRAGDGAQAAGYIDSGDWLSFREVDFGSGVTSMEARVASVAPAAASIEVHLDRVDGPLAGSCPVPVTGSLNTWAVASCPNVQADGVHDVFLVFRGGSYNLIWFRFAADAANGPTLDEGGAVDAAGFTQPLLRGSWAAVFGSRLASSERAWSFTGTTLPTVLDGTRVSVNGIDAAISYVKPTQVNFLVPDRVNIGDGVVQVFTSTGASRALPVRVDEAQPVFFNDGRYVIAQHLDYTPVTSSSPARPGEPFILWGSGFGQTWPPISTGTLQLIPAPLADPGGLRLTIGSQQAAILYAGMTVAGVYQINITVPDLATGDHEVKATLPGRVSALSVYLPVRRAGP